ncbi:erythromycin esterase family protein [Nocardia sp. NPDC024068]|uniref:erythromycin esterase family protein n=1 Tax=Nocardia sp. NPDC024068 TaxID=3157197 RepID=UPI0033C4B0EA
MTSTAPSSSTDAVSEWLRGAARPIHGTGPAGTGSDLRPLTDRLATARVVGLGESTRFSRQTYGVRDRILRTLVTEHGFRALALQDSARSGARMDAYVRTGAGDPVGALAEAWRPLRTAETAATLEWIRHYNVAHPGDQVEVFGVQPPAAGPADYDAVLTYAAARAPDRLAELESQLTPIRTAHRIDEHIQRHRGIHPGRPFAEDARNALALVESLPADGDAAADHTAALDHARLIVAFHENSVAGRGGFGGDDGGSAQTLIDRYDTTGARIVYWDGIGHTAGTELRTGGATLMRGEGSRLRAHFGADYVSVAIGFHHGDLGTAVAPEPEPDLVDAALGEVDLPAFYLDLRAPAPAPVRAWRAAPAHLRVISGMYDPAKDREARLTVDSLADAFDILVHIRETAPVDWLPEITAG